MSTIWRLRVLGITLVEIDRDEPDVEDEPDREVDTSGPGAQVDVGPRTIGFACAARAATAPRSRASRPMTNRLATTWYEQRSAMETLLLGIILSRPHFTPANTIPRTMAH